MSVSSSVHKVAIGQGITCHAWNGDRTMVALCPNSNVVNIYEGTPTEPKKWKLVAELKEHDQLVTGIDWAPKTNRIVTASQDRNAYVWTYEDVDGTMTWKPTLVILRVNRAATQVKWNLQENKFAVGSGDKHVPVCYFDESNNWWVSKIIRKHKSTVLSVAWHPTLPLVATGSSDCRLRVLTALIEDTDTVALGDLPFTLKKKQGFGEDVIVQPCNGWVHAVQWSPSGDYLAYCGHDSTVGVMSNISPDFQVQVIKLPTLPFRALQFLSNTSFVATGYEVNPTVFVQAGGGWEAKGKLDDGKKEAKAGHTSQAKKAMELFQNQAKRATTGADDIELPTKHQNAVSCLVPTSGAGGEVTSFTSSGLDGIMVNWNLGSLDATFAGLTLDSK